MFYHRWRCIIRQNHAFITVHDHRGRANINREISTQLITPRQTHHLVLQAPGSMAASKSLLVFHRHPKNLPRVQNHSSTTGFRANIIVHATPPGLTFAKFSTESFEIHPPLFCMSVINSTFYRIFQVTCWPAILVPVGRVTLSCCCFFQFMPNPLNKKKMY